MAVDVEELIIEPFRELVEKGREAIANAEAAENDDADLSKRVLKSAQSLVREGERALKRLQPLWTAQVEKHGGAFKDAVRANEEVFDKRRTLQELLYDFEDYTEIDTFDADRFAEVQAASKAFALDIMEAIRMVHVEQSEILPAFPPLPPLPASHSRARSRPRTSAGEQHRALASTLKTRTPPPDTRGRDTSAVNRRVTTGSRPSSLRNSQPSSVRHHLRRPSSPDVLGADSENIRIINKPNSLAQGSGASTSPTSPVGHRTMAWVDIQADAPSRSNKPLPRVIPEGAAVENRVTQSMNRMTLDSSARASSLFDAAYPGSLAAMTNRTSVFSSTSSSGCSPAPTSAVLNTSPFQLRQHKFDEAEATTPVLEVLQLPPATEYDNGLMLAEERTLSDADTARPPTEYRREADCSIGPKSSLYLLKGFCAGAHAFKSGGLEVATKTTFEYGTTTRVGICIHCEFRHTWDQLELDKKGDARANFSKAGVNFRLRFVYKSHLASQSISEFQYGCVFCAQAGHTVREGDATVFTNRDQLFRHLARHPQPLPAVPSVVVLYGNLLIDHPQREDYDLHFPDPPAPSTLPDPPASARLADLPAATALKNHVQRYGERDLADPDGDKTNVLTFLVGARIIGVEFPEKWGGKWCLGWHDGVHGAFPADRASLEPPGQGEVRLPGISGATVTTRWKWARKNTDGVGGAVGWLPFGKGEVITNVCWLYQEHWCWSGMNKKGKLGVFPSSHVRPDSVRETGNFADDASIKKRGKSLRLFSPRTNVSSSSGGGNSF